MPRKYCVKPLELIYITLKRVQANFGALVNRIAPSSILPSKYWPSCITAASGARPVELESVWWIGRAFRNCSFAGHVPWREVALSTAETCSVVEINERTFPILDGAPSSCVEQCLRDQKVFHWIYSTGSLPSKICYLNPEPTVIVHQWRRFFLVYQTNSDAVQTLVQSICGSSPWSTFLDIFPSIIGQSVDGQ